MLRTVSPSVGILRDRKHREIALDGRRSADKKIRLRVRWWDRSRITACSEVRSYFAHSAPASSRAPELWAWRGNRPSSSPSWSWRPRPRRPRCRSSRALHAASSFNELQARRLLGAAPASCPARRCAVGEQGERHGGGGNSQGLEQCLVHGCHSIVDPVADNLRDAMNAQ